MMLQIENEADALRLKDMLTRLSPSPDRVRDSLLHFALLCEQSGQGQSAVLLRVAAGPGEGNNLSRDGAAGPRGAAGPAGD
jgi:hypothetical protein